MEGLRAHCHALAKANHCHSCPAKAARRKILKQTRRSLPPPPPPTSSLSSDRISTNNMTTRTRRTKSQIADATSKLLQLEATNRKDSCSSWLEQRGRSFKMNAPSSFHSAIKVLIVMNLFFTSSPSGEFSRLTRGFNGQWPESGGGGGGLFVEAVSVQRLSVPDLVVINQQQLQLPAANRQPSNTLFTRQQQLQLGETHADLTTGTGYNRTPATGEQPEAAKLINNDLINSSSNSNTLPTDLNLLHQQQITFECLVSFDKKKDRNLIVKWHHDDRIEPIYQWIPELNKRSIAPQYRAYIAPIINNSQYTQELLGPINSTNQGIQLLEAGFKLIRPSKELGGKYTCSAISSQNDDSRWKKMIVYTPPRVFRFNASRTDIGLQLAGQRERLIHLSQPTATNYQQQLANNNNFNLPPGTSQQLPLAYRMRGLEQNNNNNYPIQPTTLSPQSYSTIDYVNVNQQKNWLPAFINSQNPLSNKQQLSNTSPSTSKLNGVKLVCDIDQVFPVPEVSIYRLGKLDGSHPDKLAKLDTRIEINPVSGLYHVQVISLLDDDELQMKYGPNEPIYFECLIALTNLELSKYADNKRSIVYKPGSSSNSLLSGEDLNSGTSSMLVRISPGYKLLILMLISSYLVGLGNQRRLVSLRLPD